MNESRTSVLSVRWGNVAKELFEFVCLFPMWLLAFSVTVSFVAAGNALMAMAWGMAAGFVFYPLCAHYLRQIDGISDSLAEADKALADWARRRWPMRVMVSPQVNLLTRAEFEARYGPLSDDDLRDLRQMRRLASVGVLMLTIGVGLGAGSSLALLINDPDAPAMTALAVIGWGLVVISYALALTIDGRRKSRNAAFRARYNMAPEDMLSLGLSGRPEREPQ